MCTGSLNMKSIRGQRALERGQECQGRYLLLHLKLDLGRKQASLTGSQPALASEECSVQPFLGSVPKPFSPHNLLRRLPGKPHLRDVAPRTQFSEAKEERAQACLEYGQMATVPTEAGSAFDLVMTC